MKYKGISLFSGCGGLDLGFEKVDGFLNDSGNSVFETIWANDINEAAVKTYAKNFGFEIYEDPEEEISADNKKVFLGDVKKIDFKIKVKNRIDFILGGFPCQDFSVLGGEREGIKVKRGSLYLQFVRSLIELQPLFFVAENVKGIKSANDGAAFKQIKNDFQHLNENLDELSEKTNINSNKIGQIENYKILFDNVVNFADFGVPQSRERMIFIGVRADLIKNSEEYLIKNELEKYLLKEKSLPLTPIEVFEGESLDDLNERYVKIMNEFKEYLLEMNHEYAYKFMNNTWAKYRMDISEDYKRLNNIKYNNKDERLSTVSKFLKEIGAYKNPVSEIDFKDGSNKKASTQSRIKDRMRRIPPGENHEFVRDTKYSVKAFMSNIYKRVHPLVPSPTIIANGGGGTFGYHYERERQNLTNRERARLQSFPDNFLFEGNKSDVRRQIGNSVPPLGSKRIAKAVKEIILKEIK